MLGNFFSLHKNKTEDVATTSVVGAVNASKYVCGLSFAPDTVGGAYSAPQTHSWIWGRPGGKKGLGGEGKGRKGRKRGWEGNGGPQAKILATVLHTYHINMHRN